MVENQLVSFSVEMPPSPPLAGGSVSLDDDGRLQRSGTVWTASAHIITAVIGSGILSLAWAIAQLGWVGGPVVMMLFSAISYFISTLLAACYRCGDVMTGKRNYTYTEAVKNILGDVDGVICDLLMYIELFGTAIGFTIASAISILNIMKSICYHEGDGKQPCRKNINLCMIAFGLVQTIISQISDFPKLWWTSITASLLSFLYSSICIGIGIVNFVETGKIQGSITGVTTEGRQNFWRIMEAIGEFAFAYSCSNFFFEIQDTLKSPEEKTMKKASLVSIGVTTFFYMLCGCVGYATFGDTSPTNILTGFWPYNPYWLLDIANAAVVLHLVRDYQLVCQPIFAFIEKEALIRFSATELIARDIRIRIPGLKPNKVNLFRLISRTIIVIITTAISMLLPFFNDVIGLLGALGFWPLTVYFPVRMYIKQKKIVKWSKIWFCLQLFSLACLVVTIAGITGSIAGILFDQKPYKIFQVEY